MEELRSNGALLDNGSSSNHNHNNNHNHNHNQDGNHHQDGNHNQDGDDDDDIEGEGDDLLAYKEKERRAFEGVVWKLFSRNSKLSKVSAALDIAKKTVAVLWHRWHFADESNPSQPVPPWRSLDPSDFVQQSNYRKGKVIINEIMQLLAENKQLPKQPVGKGTVTAAETLLDTGVAHIVARYLAKKRALGFKKVSQPANVLSMSFISFYDIVNVKGLEKKKEKEKERDAQVAAEED